jgi:DNA-binding XRE family transcriptional regulator
MKTHLITELIERRRKLKISQQTLAEKCAIPQSTIGRIEAGIVTPNLQTVQKMADVLGMDLKVVLKMQPQIDRWEGCEMLCFWKDEAVAYISIHDKKVRVQRFVNHPVKQIFSHDEMDIFRFSCILETRCWQRECKNIENYLKKLDLVYYDPLAIIKKTHGVSYNDFLWFKFNGENLQWRDVAPRRFRNV